LRLSPPARRIIANDPDLAPRLAGTGDERASVFVSSSGEIETKAGVRLADAARQRVPITAAGWQHF
jgi:hypothetical protein